MLWREQQMEEPSQSHDGRGDRTRGGSHAMGGRWRATASLRELCHERTMQRSHAFSSCVSAPDRVETNGYPDFRELSACSNRSSTPPNRALARGSASTWVKTTPSVSVWAVAHVCACSAVAKKLVIGQHVPSARQIPASCSASCSAGRA